MQQFTPAVDGGGERRPARGRPRRGEAVLHRYLGLSEEGFNRGWVARYASPQGGTRIQLVTRDATAPVNPVLSVRVDDIDAAHARARERGYEIVHPLTTEEWGVTRFFVRAPDGNLLDVVQHRD
ncbi:hypothetical protein GCM10009714_20870 [Microlunatus capsulatus]